MKLLLSIIAVLIINYNCFCQKEDFKYAAFNVVSSGLISSSIACLNKTKHQSLGKTFIQSFWKGCLGGSVNYASKKLLQQSSIHNSYFYAWPARLIHSMGTSIVGNGARNEKLFSSFEIDVYFTHLRYNGKMHCQIDPYTLGSAIVLLANDGYKFNLKTSAVTGSIVFDRTNYNINSPLGRSMGNTIWGRNYSDTSINCTYKTSMINGQIKRYRFSEPTITDYHAGTIAHELIHTFQYSESSVLNAMYLDKIDSKVKRYIHLNANFAASYFLAGRYNSNYFENEAQFFGK